MKRSGHAPLARWSRRALAVLGAALFSVMTLPAPGMTQEASADASCATVTDLGTLPETPYTGSEAWDINNRGQVAGNAWGHTPFGGDPVGGTAVVAPVRWDADGSITRLPTVPGWPMGSATGINDSGEVVGEARVPWFLPTPLPGTPPGGAARWDPEGNVADLGTLPGATHSAANAINERGQVAGTAYFGLSMNQHNAVRWQADGSITDLGPGQANAINNAGQVVGWSFTHESGFRAVLWGPDGSTTDLGPGQANAINDAGQVVGASAGRAVVWHPDGTMTDLGTLAGHRSAAMGINNAGQVVGYIDPDPDPDSRWAVLWNTDGSIVDLGSPEARTGSTATAINDAGQVVGWTHAPPYKPSSREPRTRHALLWDTAACTGGTGRANAAPDCSAVAPRPASLWPPNRRFHTVTLDGATDPDGDPLTLTITGVTQDEPVSGPGGRSTSPDARLGPASNEVQLRAERSGSGDGRIYRIAFTVADPHGGSCSGLVTVGVPHDRSGTPAVDSGDSFDSLALEE